MFGIIGILVSLVILIYIVYKGVGVLPASLLCSVLILLSNKINPWDGMVQAYMGGFTAFATGFLFIFILGSMFGQAMNDSGAARALSLKITQISGSKWAIGILMLTTLILTYGGINAFVVIFTVLPIAKPIFYEAHLPKRIMTAAIMAGGNIACSVIPGTPSVQNIIPTTFLGTNLFAAPALGIFLAVFLFISCWFYLEWETKRCTAAGTIAESEYITEKEAKGAVDEKDLPPWYFGAIPMIILIGVLFISQRYITPTYAVCIASILGTLAVYAMNWKRIANKINTLNAGLTNGIIPLINACGIIAFGAVVQNTPAFQELIGYVISINLNPLVTTFIAVNILAGVSGSGSGGLRIFMESMSQQLLATGVNANALHRVSTIACIGLDSLPHNISAVSVFSVVGVSYKEAYKNYFVVTGILPIIAGVISLFLAMLLY